MKIKQMAVALLGVAMMAAVAMPAKSHCLPLALVHTKLAALAKANPAAQLGSIPPEDVSRVVAGINLVPPATQFQADTILTLATPNGGLVLVILAKDGQSCNFITVKPEFWTHLLVATLGQPS